MRLTLADSVLQYLRSIVKLNFGSAAKASQGGYAVIRSCSCSHAQSSGPDVSSLGAVVE